MTIITRTRGDTWPDLFARTEDGAAVDITGRTYLLTISTLKNPTAAEAVTAELLQLTGDIISAAGGTFSFTMTEMEADIDPGTYFYDVQETITATGEVRTLAKDKYKFTQDITK